LASGGPHAEPETQNPALVGGPKPETHPLRELRNPKSETRARGQTATRWPAALL
jgi:hypothetical protein